MRLSYLLHSEYEACYVYMRPCLKGGRGRGKEKEEEDGDEEEDQEDDNNNNKTAPRTAAVVDMYNWFLGAQNQLQVSGQKPFEFF